MEWTGFSGTDKGLKQGPGRDSKGKVMQIRAITAGEGTDLLQVMEAGLGEAQVIEADW